MKNGIVKEIFNSYKEQSGGNEVKAGQLTASKIESLMKEGKIVPADLKFNQVAQDLLGVQYDDLRTADAQQVAFALQSSQFPTVSKIAVNKTIMDNYELYQPEVDSLVSEIEATQTDVEKLVGFTDPEEPELRLEGMSYQDTDFGERDVQVYMADFGRTISLTREAIFNDRTNSLISQAQSIGDYTGQHRAKMIIQTVEGLPRTAFKEAANGSKALTYKGTQFQAASIYNSNDHKAIDGRTNANLIASNGLNDYTSIQSAMQLFNKMKTPRGHEMIVNPTTILVHSDNEVKAWQILNTPQFALVGQGKVADPVISHQANPYGPGGLKKFNVIGTRYLSAAGTWYIGDPKKQLKWVWVYRPATASLAASSEKAFYNNIVMTYKFSYHGGCGHTDYTYMMKCTA
jgi:hypothetical protein